MNVLHVINTLDMGGAERLLSDLLPRLRSRGINTAVLLLGLRSRTLYDGLLARGTEAVVSSPGSIYSPGHINVIRDLVKERGYQIVHAHLFPAIYWAAIAGAGHSKVPIVATEHNTWNRRRRPWMRPLERMIYRRFARVACISAPAAHALRRWLPEITDRVCVIENGIDIEAFSRVTTAEHTGRYTIISVGRLTSQKSFDMLIRAAALLPHTTVRIVGDGPLRRELESLAGSLLVRDRVEFLGLRTDIPALLASAQVYVQPSAWEGFGIATAEAMCAGLPVVASNVPGLREVVGDAGLRFAPGSHVELAQQIETLVRNPPLRAFLAEKARARAAQFSIARTVDNYVSLYGSLCPAR